MSKRFFNWYDLKDSETLYLVQPFIEGIIAQGAKKAGSLSKLCIELNSFHLYPVLERDAGISVRVLKRLLQFVEVDFRTVNGKINEIRKGTIPSITNPKFPIDLADPKIGYLLGHIVSDGCLYYDNSRKNLIRTKYCCDQREGIDLFLDSIYAVFGKTHYTEEFVRNCIQIKFGSGVIGEVLRQAGAPVGKKFKLNESVPRVVVEGCREIKRQYLRAIFDDEGSVGRMSKWGTYLILSRSIHIDFTSEERAVLFDNVVPIMKLSYFPTGHSTKIIPIRRCLKILNGVNARSILKKIDCGKPRIIVDELGLLNEPFNITGHTYIISLHLTHSENFSLQSSLVIRRKIDVVRFYREIGFSFSKKQNKLKEALISGKWINHDSSPLQYANKKQGVIRVYQV